MTTPSVSVLPSATTANASSTPAAASTATGRGAGATAAPAGKGLLAFAEMLQRRHHTQADTDDARLDAPVRGKQEPLDDSTDDGELALTPAMALALLQQDDRFVAARLPGGTDTAATEDGDRTAALPILSDAPDTRLVADHDAGRELAGTIAGATAATLPLAAANEGRLAPGHARDALASAGNPVAREETLLSRDVAATVRTATTDTPARQAQVTDTALPATASVVAAASGARDAVAPVTTSDNTNTARLLPDVAPAVFTVPQGSRAGAAISTRTVAARAEASLRADAANLSDRELRSTSTQATADLRREAPILLTPAVFPPVATDTANATPLAPQFIDSPAPGAAIATSITSHAAAPGATPAALPGATPLPPALVAPAVGSPLWAGAFSHQMVAISQRAGATTTHTAELHLNPPDLGPLRVLLSMNGDQAQAIFVSAHGAVRSAVEAALPQLQQSLADAGIQLGQASVGEQAPQEQNNDAGRGQRRGDTRADAGTESAVTPEAPVRVTEGLIDAYA